MDNDEIKKRVRQNFARLVECFDPEGQVLDCLFRENIITVNQMTEISKLPNRQDRAAKLIGFLISSVHPNAFLAFREALSMEDRCLIEMLDSGKYGQ